MTARDRILITKIDEIDDKVTIRVNRSLYPAIKSLGIRVNKLVSKVSILRLGSVGK